MATKISVLVDVIIISLTHGSSTIPAQYATLDLILFDHSLTNTSSSETLLIIVSIVRFVVAPLTLVLYQFVVLSTVISVPFHCILILHIAIAFHLFSILIDPASEVSQE